jgi:hypothetical protein
MLTRAVKQWPGVGWFVASEAGLLQRDECLNVSDRDDSRRRRRLHDFGGNDVQDLVPSHARGILPEGFWRPHLPLSITCCPA